jgi:hypothetical protein
MNFTDRHGPLIGYVEIPGVDVKEDDDDHLPGVVPVIADDIEITGVDVEGTHIQFRLHKLRLTISTFTMPTQLQLR